MYMQIGGEKYNVLEVYKDNTANHFVILLQLQAHGHHVVRIMCDGNVIGPDFFTVIYLTGKLLMNFTRNLPKRCLKSLSNLTV
jgi:hypothetical protein